MPRNMMSTYHIVAKTIRIPQKELPLYLLEFFRVFLWGSLMDKLQFRTPNSIYTGRPGAARVQCCHLISCQRWGCRGRGPSSISVSTVLRAGWLSGQPAGPGAPAYPLHFPQETLWRKPGKCACAQQQRVEGIVHV